MRSYLLSLTLFGAVILPVAAFGDTLTYFALSGALQKGGTLSGTIMVSQTSGNVLSSNLTLVEQGVAYQFGSVRAIALDPTLTVSFEDAAINKDPDQLTLDFPVTTLNGYAGGSLCSLTFACQSQHPGDFFGLQSFIIIKFGYSDSPTFTTLTDTFTSLSTSPVSATPEPAALGLVGLGLAAVAGAAQRRLRGSELPRR